MSTKIFNAYQYNGNIGDLFNELKCLREQYHKKVINMLQNSDYLCGQLSLSPRIFEEFCEQNFHGESTDQVAVMKVCDLPNYKLHAYLEAMIRSHINCEMNITASAVVYFHRDKSYVHFFGLKDLKLSKQFVDFHYQDYGDKPEQVTSHEWQQRKRVWDAIFKDNPIPSVCGLTYEFHSDLFHLCIDAKKVTGHQLEPISSETWDALDVLEAEHVKRRAEQQIDDLCL
jgi:hypothetical protein